MGLILLVVLLISIYLYIIITRFISFVKFSVLKIKKYYSKQKLKNCKGENKTTIKWHK